MAQKTYFAMPSHDYEPDRSIRLGQIITSPTEPWNRLADPLPVPRELVQTSRKEDWGTEVHKLREHRIGIWAQFAAMILGVGADLVVEWSKNNADVFQFSELVTTFFEPDADFVKRSVLGEGCERVTEWAKKKRGKPLYMVTGIKVARGAQHMRSRIKGVDVEFKPGVEATPFIGVPISGGLLVGGGKSKGEAVWYSDSSDFVFAYRLRRIIIKKQTVATNKSFVKGATVAHLDHDVEETVAEGKRAEKRVKLENDVDEEVEIQSVEHSRSDFGSGGYHLDGFFSVKVIDEEDDQGCLLQFPEDALPAL